MQKPDDNLRHIFLVKLPGQWTAIETWGVSKGVPDSEFCLPNGVSGWVEYKATRSDTVDLRPMQISWLTRRSHLGGRAFIAIRKRLLSGGKLIGHDELYLFRASGAISLKNSGIEKTAGTNHFVGAWRGGPSKWNWKEVEVALSS